MRAICVTRRVERELGPFAVTEMADPNWALITGTATPGPGFSFPGPGSVFLEWPSGTRHLSFHSNRRLASFTSHLCGAEARCERGREKCL